MSELTALERPPGFVYRKSGGRDSRPERLYCDRVPLEELVRRFGTPLYVYSALAIRSRIGIFQHALSNIPHTLCYSVKANSNLSLLRLVSKLKCGFDVVSGGELARVHEVDPRAARKTVFSGVGKTAAEIEAALRAGILIFNIESLSELGRVAACAARQRKKARLAFRVNPDVPAKTHPYISTGLHRHKFGVPVEQARALYAQAAKLPWVEVAGVSVHIGSQINDVSPFASAMQRVASLVRQLRREGHRIKYVDAGGGLGIPYEHGNEDPFSARVNAYVQAIARPLRDLRVHLLLEPGRSIVGPSGALLTRVIYRKANQNKRFVIVDAAMNDLLRPSLYRAHHDIAPLELGFEENREITDVVGPICESGDFLALDRELPPLQEGALLAVLDAGAYGMSLSSNYNSRPRAAEVLIDGKLVKLVRRRETVDDLYRHEAM